MKGPIQLSGEKITIEFLISILTLIKELSVRLVSSSGVALENENSPVSGRDNFFCPLS